MTFKSAALTLSLCCSGLAAAQGNVLYDSRLPTPTPKVSAQERTLIKGLATQAARAKAWDTSTYTYSGCAGDQFEILGVAPGAFTKKGAKQTAYLYRDCYVSHNNWSQGIVITEGSTILAHYTFMARTLEMYALKDINRNGYTELALSGRFGGQGYTSGYLEVAEFAPQRRLLASFSNLNKLSVWEDNCGAVESGGTWESRVIRVTPGAVPRFTQQPIAGRCGNERTATSQKTVQAVNVKPEPTSWKAVPVTSAASSGINILGTTTPFSATALCQKVGCRVLGNAQVGGYLFATYTTKNTYSVGSEGYFAFLKNGKTVAVGVYALGSQDITLAGNQQDLKDLVALTGKPLPDLRGVMGSPDGSASSGGGGDTVLRRDRNVTLPLGGGLVLTNRSQRVALASTLGAKSKTFPHRFIDVAYVALDTEVESIARLINRWSPAEQQVARQAYLKTMGLSATCPNRRTNGPGLSMKDVGRESPTAAWAVARGYTLNANTFSLGLSLPGLALSAIEMISPGGKTMEEAFAAPLCVR